MLMNIKCSAVTSVAVHSQFDDNSTKDQVISKGDLIDVEYNRNGCRTRFQGKVIKILKRNTVKVIGRLVKNNNFGF